MIRHITAAHSIQPGAEATSRFTRQPAPVGKPSFDQQLSGALKQIAAPAPAHMAKNGAPAGNTPPPMASQRIGGDAAPSRQLLVAKAASASISLPVGFSQTDRSGATAPAGMGDLMWDIKNQNWVSASAAKDRGWWNEQSAGWQTINAMPQGQERIQAAISYAAAHPNEPMLGQVGGYGYGPRQVNLLASQYGYTWMPGIGGDPIELAPGLTMPNSTLKQYDPSHPPGGSIMVDMNLVNG